MTNPPAGWYPDPAPQSAPGRQRYWDGSQWTEHLHDPYPAPTPSPYPGASYPQAQAQQPAQEPAPAYGATYGQPYGQALQSEATTTPDGVPLAGWWWRVLARVLDGFIIIPLNVLAVLPVVISQWDELSQWFDDLSYAADHNTPDPPGPALLDFTTAPGLILLFSILAAYVLYETVFLLWKQATPGKLIVGLRVRRRDTPDLPGSRILTRVGFVLLGQFCIVLLLLDYLWPLWDSKKQALHDKVADTNVVRPGRIPSATEAGLPPRW